MELLGWSIVFLIAAIVFGILGFSFLAGISATVAKWLFIIFIVLFVIYLIKHLSK